MRGIFFDNFTIELPASCVGQGGCWRHEPVARAYDQDFHRFFYHKLLEKKDPVFFDIGANTGSVALMAAIAPGALCVAFEPYRATYDALVEAVRLNGIGDRVRVENLALSDHNGSTALFVPQGPETGMCRIRTGWGLDNPTVHEVQCATLDDYMTIAPHRKLTPHPDFISLDVEGAELLVLRGGVETLKRHHPGLLLEWAPAYFAHYGYSEDDVEEFILNCGYNHMEKIGVVDRYYTRQ